jgi:hypothetical protein
MLPMEDAPDVTPEERETPEGIEVFFEGWPGRFPGYSEDEIEAQLPDGTRLKAVPLGGTRLGFERPVPRGTVVFARGRPFRAIGHSE